MAKKILAQTKKKIVSPQILLEAKKNLDGSSDVARTKMRVIGIGGGGSNIVSEIAQRLQKADFIAANTDLQALKSVSKNTKKFAFGQASTKGFGCGMDSSLGVAAAQEDKERIKRLLEGQDLCVFVAALGGGTGSGATPVFAEVCHELKNLSFGIFIMPFSFEGEKRKQLAKEALEKLKPLLNAYAVIQNDKIFQIVDKSAPLRFALSSVNKKLVESLEGFVETLFFPGLINIDFADVKALLQGKGRLAYLSSAVGLGEDRVKSALDQVLLNPLYEYESRDAERILFNIAGSEDLKMDEVARISKTIFDQNPKAKIIFGVSSNQKFQKKLRITVFAIGCEETHSQGFSLLGVLPKRGQETKKTLAHAQKNGAKHHSKKQKASLMKRNKEIQKLEIAPEHALTVFAGDVQGKQRRNALEVRKAVDEEIEELQKKEKEWDIPAFLRNKRS